MQFKESLAGEALRKLRASIPVRSDFRSLIRSRAVQGLLLGTAALQGAAAVGGRGEEVQPQAGKAAIAMSLAPAVAGPPASLPPTLAKAGPRTAWEVSTLAEKYRRKGYQVSDKLALEIHQAAVDNRIDPALAFGLVRAESDFKNSATSRVGAVGLTQLMPSTARWFDRDVTVRDLRDSQTNLRIGFGYLRELMDKYDGDTRLALLAYNRGPGTVDRILKRGGNPDNGYVEMVLQR